MEVKRQNGDDARDVENEIRFILQTDAILYRSEIFYIFFILPAFYHLNDFIIKRPERKREKKNHQISKSWEFYSSPMNVCNPNKIE